MSVNTEINTPLFIVQSDDDDIMQYDHMHAGHNRINSADEFENTERIALKKSINYNVIHNKHNKKKRTCFILHPHDPFRLIWDIFVMIILIYTCIEVPFTLAFGIELTLKMTAGICALLIDAFLLIDICFNFRTAYFPYYNPYQLITDPSEIAKAYLKSWFILDLFTSIPFEFVLPANHEATQWIKMLRIFRLLRSLKLLRFFRMMKTFNNVLRRVLTRSVIVILRLIRILFLMILTAHYTACIWWFIGKESLSSYDESWIQNDKLNMLDPHVSLMESYIKSFYFAVGTLYTTGYGDITPMNTTEEVIGSIIILVGTCFFAYFIGTVALIVHEGDAVHTMQLKKMEEAQAFCASNKLSPPLSIDVMTHLKYFWSKKTNSCIDIHDEMIQCLPPQIQRNVAKHCDKRYCMDEMEIFKGLNSYIRGLIALKVRAISCGGDEYLFKEHEFGHKLYIQRTGTSLITSSFDNECIKSQRGTVCGYLSFIKPQRQCSLKTSCFSEFWTLDVCDMQSVLKNAFPTTWETLWNLIKHEIKILYKKQQVHLTVNMVNNNDNNCCNKWRKCINIKDDDNIRNVKVQKTAKKIKGNVDYEQDMKLMQKQIEKRRQSLNINMEDKEETKTENMSRTTMRYTENKEAYATCHSRCCDNEENKENGDNEENDDNKDDDKEENEENDNKEENEESEEVKNEIELSNRNTKQLLLVVPKQEKKFKKKKKKKKEQQQTIFVQDDDESSSSMFGENSLNSLTKSIAMNDNDDLGPLLNATVIGKYSLIESQTKSD